MDDKQIIELYFERNEQAIKETEKKHGRFCHCIAMNVLGIYEDAEECVNDTYYSVWKQIPPTIPEIFKVYLGRITRNLSISRIELGYCMIQTGIFLVGYYSKIYWIATILLLTVVSVYIFWVNPKYTNRRMTKEKNRK